MGEQPCLLGISVHARSPRNTPPCLSSPTHAAFTNTPGLRSTMSTEPFKRTVNCFFYSWFSMMRWITRTQGGKVTSKNSWQRWPEWITSLCFHINLLINFASVCARRLKRDLCLQAVAAEFQNESAAALAAAATRHLQEAEQAKNSGNEHWWGPNYGSVFTCHLGWKNAGLKHDNSCHPAVIWQRFPNFYV